MFHLKKYHLELKSMVSNKNNYVVFKWREKLNGHRSENMPKLSLFIGRGNNSVLCMISIEIIKVSILFFTKP